MLNRIDIAVTPSYPVFIGPGVLDTLPDHINHDHLVIITDTNLEPLYARKARDLLVARGKTVVVYSVPSGESSKSFETFEHVLRAMLRDGLDRKSAVLAIGGGVVGDLAGFVAASFMRGISVYQCPTSLLAMVDASVGGKTGVNVPEGKNLVGAFWQPKAVFADVQVLATLPDKEFKQGAVELFKHGLIADAQLLQDVQHPEFHSGGDAAFLRDSVARAVHVKAGIVAADEHERGVRAYLNLGHTLAHALEAHSQHAMPHGDAVAHGLVFAAKLAKNRGFTSLLAETLAFRQWMGPAPLFRGDFAALKPFIQRDKKHHSGTQNWVLLSAPQQPSIVSDITPNELMAAWEFLQSLE